jgi:hypothetical protein
MAGMKFENETVRIAVLADDEGAIRDAEFRTCEIKGPALIAPFDCVFDSPKWHGDLDAIIWEVPPERGPIIGAIELRDCRFHACTFVNVGLAVTPELAAQVRASAGH